MKYLFAVAILLVAVASSAQDARRITGQVKNVETGAPIASASVFLSNTSKGTISDKAGNFDIQNIPDGSYELVISSVGFTTEIKSFSSSDLPLTLHISLKPKITELNSVVVEPFEKDGWKKWGKLFLENFIGTTEEAAKCTIRNTKAIRFRYSKKHNRLNAFADEPLIIENRALGYRLKYQLEDFSMNFSDHMTIFLGYPLFEDMSQNRKHVPKRWIESRRKAFTGSLQHFMKSLYNNELQEQGFMVRRLFREANTEKERIRMMIRTSHQSPREIGAQAASAGKTDSSQYYQRILEQPDFIESFGKDYLSADSLISEMNDQQKAFFFENYLAVTFTKETEEKKYLLDKGENRHPYHQRSTIFLTEKSPLIIEKNGVYQPPQILLTSGYWGWSEKIADLLPVNGRWMEDN